ncbi:hypothetical protein GCM10007301_09300 [Azorhizobium oxalatiphilum]|uniref:NIF system FeS cluster assembly NifU C-terminal domain-containing protein n=1 Tax=Azorhizobium oxalatiphilum TaxID=980631 RepID=A0A917BMS4_9HYPH|nr:hypothetical protein GCM10007301_09300 [Azorhizobium oxalatiphilum]
MQTEKLQIEETQTLDAPPAMESERERTIRAVIEEIRPNLQRDGGDCVLVGIEGNKVMVKLTGACVFCKLASVTMEGIQSRIVEKLGELVRLVPVAGPARH